MYHVMCMRGKAALDAVKLWVYRRRSAALLSGVGRMHIMIHGLKNGVRMQGDWTQGCIAVTDEEMDEIWGLAGEITARAIQGPRCGEATGRPSPPRKPHSPWMGQPKPATISRSDRQKRSVENRSR